MRKFLSFKTAIIPLLSLTALTGCGGTGTGNNSVSEKESIVIDTSKTQLYIGNYDGDLGHAWLDEVAARFMEANPDVQVIVNNEKDLFSDSNLQTNMPGYNNDLYFLNGITYSAFVGKGLLSDITNEVTTNLPGETESIESKMNSTHQKYYKTSEGKYYAVPFFDAVFGAMYDVDLFDEEGFYFNTDGKLFCDSRNNKTKSAGPNGKVGDFDDGLPATFSQWKTLVDMMDESSITPYVWTGKYDYYRHRFLTSIWADYEGKDNFDINLSLKGTYTFEGDSQPTTITKQNGYLLQNQKGKEYALEYAKYIIENGYYNTDSFDTVNTHTMAQNTFLLSVRNPKVNRIGMILEGAWWENNAKTYMGTMATKFGEEYGFGERNFGFMPTPKADDGSSNPGTTLVSSTGNSVVCVNAASQQQKLAKEFLVFAHSDESLRTFTRVTGAVRPYSYDLTENDRNQMSYYAKTMWDVYRSKDTQISYITIFQDNVFVSEPSFLGGTNWFWGSNVDGALYTDAFYEFSEDSNLTVSKYVAGMKDKYSKSEWDKVMSKYYN